MGMTRGRCGDDGDDVGTTGTTCGGDHGDNGDHGDHMGTFWGLWGWCGDDGDDMGTTWGWRGDHRDNIGWRPQRQRRPRRPQVMETTWGPSGGYGDDVGTMGMTRGWRGRQGQRGDHGDNEITKNAITFERIEIIEFRLKIWDPWTLPHTCRLQLMCWLVGCPIPNGIFIQKVLWWPSKKFFHVFALDPIRPYLDWALRGFLTSWPIYDPLKLQLKWKQSAKFD